MPPANFFMPASCQHQCLVSCKSSRRPPETPPAQSCGPLNIYPTKSNITWIKDGIHFFIKKSKTDQVGRGITMHIHGPDSPCISMGQTHHESCLVVALQAYFECCRAPSESVLLHFQTGPPLTSWAMRAILQDLLLRTRCSLRCWCKEIVKEGGAEKAKDFMFTKKPKPVEVPEQDMQVDYGLLHTVTFSHFATFWRCVVSIGNWANDTVCP